MKARQITIDDLGPEAQKKPDEQKEPILKRAQDYLAQIQKLWAI